MARLLKGLDHDVHTAASVQAAIQTAGATPVDLVISDLGLPDGTGLELMRQLRQQYGLKGICLSGFGMERDMLDSRDAGFVGHLTKPVDFQKLQQLIDQVVSAG